MTSQNVQAPIILLLDQDGIDNALVKTWFEQSRFSVVEAANAFQLLEEISDFTVRRCPDVIILDAASILSEFSLIKDMIHISKDEAGIPIFILSDSETSSDQEEYFKGNLAQLSVELDKIIPPKEIQPSFAV